MPRDHVLDWCTGRKEKPTMELAKIIQDIADEMSNDRMINSSATEVSHGELDLLLDAAERTEKAEASLTIAQQRLTEAGANLIAAQGDKRKAEAILHDNDLDGEIWRCSCGLWSPTSIMNPSSPHPECEPVCAVCFGTLTTQWVENATKKAEAERDQWIDAFGIADDTVLRWKTQAEKAEAAVVSTQQKMIGWRDGCFDKSDTLKAVILTLVDAIEAHKLPYSSGDYYADIVCNALTDAELLLGAMVTSFIYPVWPGVDWKQEWWWRDSQSVNHPVKVANGVPQMTPDLREAILAAKGDSSDER